MSVALALDFINTETLDARITASGGVNGTRVNSSKLIVAASAPRYDYDRVTGAPRGLMREPARTNLCKQSQAAATTPWGAFSSGGGSNPTVTNNYAVSPDGTSNATRIQTNTNSGGGGRSGQIQTLATVISTAYFTTFWTRATTGADVGNQVQVTVGSIGAKKITLTADWTQTTISGTDPVGNAQILFETRDTVTTNPTADFLLWGVQVEAGAFATSYIPTTTVAVTRSLDTFIMTGTNFSNWFNASEGTFFSEWEEGGDSTTTQIVVSANDATTSNSIDLKRQNSTLLREQVTTSGSVVCAAGQSVNYVFGQLLRGAAAYKANDFSFSANGLPVVTDTAGALPTVNQLNIGQLADGTNSFCGHFRWIIYDNTRVVDASLVADSAFNIGGITGAATVAGGGAAAFPSVGSITGAATVSSMGRALFPSIATATGIGTASGIGLFPQISIGSSVGAATVSGASLWAQLGVGLSIGAGVASGVGRALFPSPGTIVGAATVLGVGAFGVLAVGTIVGAATVVGGGTELFPSVGFSEGASIIFANGAWGVARAPHIDGAALVFGAGADGHTVPPDRSFRIPVQRRSIAVSD